MPESTPTTYQAAVGCRGDCLYCPLPLSIDSYWNCLTDCHHCYFRRLNRTWGTDLRPADPEAVRRKLESGLKNKNPRSPLAAALSRKITIRIGNKTDPYQDAEREHRVTRRILEHLQDLNWSYVVQTRFPGNLLADEDVFSRDRFGGNKALITIMPVISPGAERDWETFERKRTTPIDKRLRLCRRWIRAGYEVGVNGEPFIPGFHTVREFRDMLRRLKSHGIPSYNTYNFHWNDYVAKRLDDIGVDIERIWYHNRDVHWKPILQQLLAAAKREGIRLGCPDFVNTGWRWKEEALTCCGINVQNPSTSNTHFWKLRLQEGETPEEILEDWNGIGDRETAGKILRGDKCDFYTMRDANEEDID